MPKVTETSDYFASYMVASRREGSLLDTSLTVTTREPKLINCLKAVFGEIVYQFDWAGFCCEHYDINGVCRGQEVSNFSGTRSTQVHEETHQELQKVWATPETSFDEGLAYADQYTEKDPKMAKRFR